MPFALSARSRERLAGVHPHLVGVVERAIAISPLDFTVLEGLRTLERQRQLAAGAETPSMMLSSRIGCVRKPALSARRQPANRSPPVGSSSDVN